MKKKGFSFTTHGVMICIAAFLLFLGSGRFFPVDAAVFPCDTVSEIQNALWEAERNGQNDIIFIAPGEYRLYGPLIYEPIPTENHRILIGGLPSDKPVLNGRNSSHILFIHHNILGGGAGDRFADVYITDLVFLNGDNTRDMPVLSSGGLNIWTEQADIKVENCLFQGNHSTTGKGAGAYLATSQNGNIVVENNIFAYNTNDEGDGGGLAVDLGDVCNVDIVNNTIVCNVAGESGAGMFINVAEADSGLEDRMLNISNNILFWNYSMGRDVAVVDPLHLMTLNVMNNIVVEFIHNGRILPGMDPSNRDIHPGVGLDYTLEPGSPCIDSGDHSPMYDFPVLDHFGRYRIMDGDGNGSHVVDRGAMEFQPREGTSRNKRLFQFIPDLPLDSLKNSIHDPEDPVRYLRLGDIADHTDKTVGWTLSGRRYVSGGYALYYGNPSAGNYQTDRRANRGSLTIRDVDLNKMKEPALSFLLYMDTEPGDRRDTLTVWADGKLLWKKDDQTVQMKKWQLIEIPLDDFRDQVISLIVRFDTRDSKDNRGEGLYIDDFRIYDLSR